MPTDRVLDGPVTWQLVASAILPTLLVAWLGARLARRLVQHEVTQGTSLDALERAKRARTLGTSSRTWRRW
jgi:hypothetical protein